MTRKLMESQNRLARPARRNSCGWMKLGIVLGAFIFCGCESVETAKTDVSDSVSAEIPFLMATLDGQVGNFKLIIYDDPENKCNNPESEDFTIVADYLRNNGEPEKSDYCLSPEDRSKFWKTVAALKVIDMKDYYNEHNIDSCEWVIQYFDGKNSNTITITDLPRSGDKELPAEYSELIDLLDGLHEKYSKLPAAKSGE